jgi:hypothetical protein
MITDPTPKTSQNKKKKKKPKSKEAESTGAAPAAPSAGASSNTSWLPPGITEEDLVTDDPELTKKIKNIKKVSSLKFVI